jgi:hypothetical protein
MNDATVAGVTSVDPDYLKMGIYRSKSWTSTQVIYLTPMVIGTTLGSVSSGQTPGTSPPTPSVRLKHSVRGSGAHAGTRASASHRRRGDHRHRRAVTSRRRHRSGRG